MKKPRGTTRAQRRAEQRRVTPIRKALIDKITKGPFPPVDLSPIVEPIDLNTLSTETLLALASETNRYD